ncbi:MAG: hypothetical protein ACFFD1_06260 [Candidatus Thorarchaeota archaeon]
MVNLSSALNRNNLSLKQGDTFDFEVINDGRSQNQGFRSRTFTGTGSFPFTRTGSFPFTRTGSGNFGNGFFGNLGSVSYENFVLRPSVPVPTTGTIYAVVLKQLPSNDSEGILTYDIPGQQSRDITTYYAYGDPIISTDWSGWKTELTNIITDMNTQATIKFASMSINYDTADYFGTTISVELNPTTTTSTSGFNFQISNIVFTQTIRYEKSTGKRLEYSLTSQFTTQNGEQTSTAEINFTTAATRLAPAGSDLSSNIILIVAVIGTFIVAGAGMFFYRSSKKPTSHVDVIQKANIKEKALLDDLKLRLQNANTNTIQKSNINQTNSTNLIQKGNPSKSGNKAKNRPRRR